MKLNLMTVLILLVLALTTPAHADFEVLEDELTTKGDPLNEDFGFNEADTSWTQWNVFWATTAFVGQSADLLTTANNVNGTTCVEKNPIVGEDPSVASLVALKVGVIAAAAYVIENWVEPENRQTIRNWWYGSLGISGMALGIYNYNECD
jgi:hypothetical protein